ncbi:MAG: Na+/H+ antiporter subunit E [Planctomycetota bacterium]
MNLLFANILLALVWAMTLGDFTPANFAVGFLLGYVLLHLASSSRNKPLYFVKVGQAIRFHLFAFKELIRANFRMVRYTLSPLNSVSPGILAIPLNPDMSETEITVLANLVTLTPGTLSLDVSADRSTLFVHYMHIEDPEAERRDITEGFERRLLELTR